MPCDIVRGVGGWGEEGGGSISDSYIGGGGGGGWLTLHTLFNTKHIEDKGKIHRLSPWWIITSLKFLFASAYFYTVLMTRSSLSKVYSKEDRCRSYVYLLCEF
jgi:hypothetical protein